MRYVQTISLSPLTDPSPSLGPGAGSTLEVCELISPRKPYDRFTFAPRRLVRSSPGTARDEKRCSLKQRGRIGGAGVEREGRQKRKGKKEFRFGDPRKICGVGVIPKLERWMARDIACSHVYVNLKIGIGTGSWPGNPGRTPHTRTLSDQDMRSRGSERMGTTVKMTASYWARPESTPESRAMWVPRGLLMWQAPPGVGIHQVGRLTYKNRQESKHP